MIEEAENQLANQAESLKKQVTLLLGTLSVSENSLKSVWLL